MHSGGAGGGGGGGGGAGGGARSRGHRGGGDWGEDPDFVASFSDGEDEEADELDGMRMSRYSSSGGGGGSHPHSRSKSLMRYNEIERERSRRRQHIVKQKNTSKFSPGTLKLSMMNAGLIPLKKGKETTSCLHRLFNFLLDLGLICGKVCVQCFFL